MILAVVGIDARRLRRFARLGLGAQPVDIEGDADVRPAPCPIETESVSPGCQTGSFLKVLRFQSVSGIRPFF